MPRNTMSCPRCGYTADRLSQYVNHINRQRRCAPVLQDIEPTLDNMIRNGAPLPAPVTILNTPTNTNEFAIHGDHNRVTNNNTMNANTTNNTHINNNFNVPKAVLPMGYEDLAHITADMWGAVVHRGVKDVQAAVQMLALLINFNQANPGNMNVYFPKDGEHAALFSGSPPRWSWKWKDDAAQTVLDKNAVHFTGYVQEHGQQLIGKEQAKQLENSIDNAYDRDKEQVAAAMTFFEGVSAVTAAVHPKTAQMVESGLREWSKSKKTAEATLSTATSSATSSQSDA